MSSSLTVVGRSEPPSIRSGGANSEKKFRLIIVSTLVTYFANRSILSASNGV